jgi:hypothetical protein
MKGLEISFKKNIIAWGKYFKIYESIQNIMWIMKKRYPQNIDLMWNIESQWNILDYESSQVFETYFLLKNKYGERSLMFLKHHLTCETKI